MITFVKSLNKSQWIMLGSAVIITSLMVVANNAHAASLRSASTTLSHCGWVPARDIIYTSQPRNIEIIQSHLTSLGYDVGAPLIDGRYGRYTKGAVTNFQREYGLQVDGIVGIETATQLAYQTHPYTKVRECQRPYRGGWR